MQTIIGMIKQTIKKIRFPKKKYYDFSRKKMSVASLIAFELFASSG